jgi:hypothetical protein
MAIPYPVTQTKISTTQWGIPITDAVNKNATDIANNATSIASNTAALLNSPAIPITLTLAALTLGNGTNQAWLSRLSQGMVAIGGKLTFGSSTAITGALAITLPYRALAPSSGGLFMSCAGTSYSGLYRNPGANGTNCPLYVIKTDAAFGTMANIVATVPATWVAGNFIEYYVTYLTDAI